MACSNGWHRNTVKSLELFVTNKDNGSKTDTVSKRKLFCKVCVLLLPFNIYDGSMKKKQ